MFVLIVRLRCNVESFWGDLVILEIVGFNVILGMDWFSRHHALIDY
jgi:hypothetical protein